MKTKEEDKISYSEIIQILIEIPSEDFKYLIRAVKKIRKGNKLIDDAIKQAEETILAEETVEELKDEQQN